MASFERFEDIEAWKRARNLARLVYSLSGSGNWARDFALRDQIRRAAISVLSNIAEGFERGSDAEFARFLGIAKGSAGELRAQLYIALDQGYLTEPVFTEATAQAAEVSRMTAGLIRYLKE